MTSATEVLRRLLDERGVEWWQSANTLGCVFTRWHSPLFGDEVCAMENGEEGLVLFDHFMTPAQAIDATLGRGTCEVEESWHGESELVEYHCTACDEYMVVEVVKPDGAQRPNYCPNCGRRCVG